MRYTGTAITLHWLIALGIAGAFSVGLYMHELPLSPWKLKIYSWHKWAGVTIFLLAVLRVLWRLTHRPPVPVPMPRWQHLVAEGTHRLLYVLILAVPLTGWLMSSAKGIQTVYFGVLPIPDLLAKNTDLGDQLKEVHETLNWVMAFLVGGHVLAALKHHLIDRDDTLRRMLPRF
ncbi:MAG: cytochrome b [Proteobacteria bacterium]|nr:cytochrome b [Pseudomonadota bacterium]HQR04168.1 cytochrome b [Rhodocyclaceae bacterium]